jgi:hypothetical protein
MNSFLADHRDLLGRTPEVLRALLAGLPGLLRRDDPAAVPG